MAPMTLDQPSTPRSRMDNFVNKIRLELEKVNMQPIELFKLGEEQV